MRHLSVSVSLAMLCYVAATHAASTGTAGHSGKDPKRDCTACHAGGSSHEDFTIAGPATVSVESTAAYTLTLHGTTGRVAGVNVTASEGLLQPGSDDMRASATELVHARPRQMDASGSLSFKFYWSAPETPGAQTLFISAVVANGDQTPQRDDTLVTQVEVDVVDPGAAFNQPPLAYLHVPSAALVGDAVSMNAARSRDIDGNIVSYEWDFGDGNTKKLDQPSIEHKYASPGFYSPQVVVTDDDGLTGSAIAQIEVMAGAGGARPQAAAGGPYVTLVAQEVRFDGGNSRPSHKEGEIVSYEWDFGDGSFGSGPVPTHIYDRPGRYVATLTVWDDRGLPNSAVAQVNVQEGETAKLGSLRVPSRIAIWEGEGVRYPFQLSVGVSGIGDGVTRCGVVYLERNGEDYRHQTFCVTGTEQRRLTFEHMFLSRDAPTVEWTAYAVLENGAESERQTRTSKVVIFPVQRR